MTPEEADRRQRPEPDEAAQARHDREDREADYTPADDLRSRQGSSPLPSTDGRALIRRPSRGRAAMSPADLGRADTGASGRLLSYLTWRGGNGWRRISLATGVPLVRGAVGSIPTPSVEKPKWIAVWCIRTDYTSGCAGSTPAPSACNCEALAVARDLRTYAARLDEEDGLAWPDDLERLADRLDGGQR